MNIEQEVNEILLRGSVQGRSKEILEHVNSRLTDTTGIIVIELRGHDDSTIYRSCNLPRAIYELRMAEAMLVNIRLGVDNDNTIDHDDDDEEEKDNG
jgi:hypothetical protein